MDKNHNSDKPSSLLSQAPSSTSSGYQSENDTNTSSPTSAPLAKTSNVQHNPKRRSVSTGERFTEEELTLTFGDSDSDEERLETRGAQPKQSNNTQSPPQIYKEYNGEDFAQYLQDDTDDFMQPPQQYNTEKRYKKRRGQQQPHLHSGSAPNTMQRSGLKDKITKVFTLSRSSKAPQAPANSIHNFSYADSKIFELNGGADGVLDTCSDIGGTSTAAWWGKDTLSARSLRAHSDIGIGKKSTSEPNLAGPYTSSTAKKAKKKGLWKMFTNSKNKKPHAPPPSREDVESVSIKPLKHQQSYEDVRL